MKYKDDINLMEAYTNILEESNESIESLKDKLDLMIQDMENMVWSEELPHLIQKQKKKVDELREKIKQMENKKDSGSK
jgi:polyhydroxyalkanoate synthesis regulator phasin